ncbi:c-type cytochrome [Aestuariivivens insulae]|uniref:c-type cytochrome n=1 Tax=Aestuariivivens insulae TaxID=1621988 RepID=UPI001F5A2B56|nr:c-type cytochrome [Aestuariivivens insulae]
MNLKHFIYAFLSISLLLNCSSGGDDPSEPNTNNPDPDPDTSGKVTYDADIKSIMTSNCTSCHGSPTSQGAPMSLTTFSQVKANVDKIITRVNSSSNPMPPASNGTLSSSEKNLIQQWKDDGLLEK